MKKFKILIVLAIIVSINVTTVFAYSLESYRIVNKSANIFFSVGSYTYVKTAWQNAISDWHSKVSSNFYEVSPEQGCALTIMNEASSSLYGRTTFTVSGNRITGFVARINVGNSNLSGASATNKAKIARSTAGHELGHLLGLDDIYSGTAIMNVNRSRTSIYTPQTDDVNGVNAGY